ncbi:uncharacterized protein LOC127699086 [Mytilus californianus]|uniref:uncharacterized protein LOC127699086 n=1 Tax=Mytilus californianus TaxID=6549 RepID=UPI002245025D|nr:uncharacterized protein LOC127699086 [Mytilus californianus]
MKQEYPNASDTSEKLPTCTTNTSTVEYQQQVDVQKISAEWSMICSLSYIIPGMFSNINLATYSDVYETLPESRKRKHVSPLDNMKRVLECYSSDFSPKGKRWMFILLIFIFSMSAISNLSRHNN